MRMHLVSWIVIALLAMFLAPAVQAVPSFTRQTGMNCATCHTVFPQLTPFGRIFKLSGYTLANGAFNEQAQQSNRLSENTMAPLSAMLLADYTSMKSSDTGSVRSKTKDTVQFPQQLSLFYAGRVSNELGAFAQVTLDSSNTIAMDNADVRYAKTATAGGMPLIYGISLNNSPTVEDIVNTTPVWGFPFSAPDYANSPDFSTLLGGGAFAQTTAGAVAYAMLNNHWYVAAGSYHDTQASSEATNVGLQGWAPYLRVLYQAQVGASNFDIGVYAMSGNVTTDVKNPDASNTATFKDIGVDGQYQYEKDVHTVTLHANYINERLFDAVNLGASKDNLNIRDVSINGEYYYDRTYGVGLGRFCKRGRPDTTLYTDGPAASGDNRSISGSPDSNGWVFELNYVPWLNTKFSLQYTTYSEFDGGATYTSGNTGTVRNAKDNNALYVASWINF